MEAPPKGLTPLPLSVALKNRGSELLSGVLVAIPISLVVAFVLWAFINGLGGSVEFTDLLMWAFIILMMIDMLYTVFVFVLAFIRSRHFQISYMLYWEAFVIYKLHQEQDAKNWSRDELLQQIALRRATQRLANTITRGFFD